MLATLVKAGKPQGAIIIAMALLLTGCRSQSPFDLEARPGFMLEPSQAHIRIMTYNIGWDSIFQEAGLLDNLVRHDSRAAAFARVVRAIDPDVICLQEIDPARDPGQVALILEAAIPQGNGKEWQLARGQDNVIASVYSLSLIGQQVASPGDFLDFGHAMALVDLPDPDFPMDLYVICTHLPALGGQENISARQQHADTIAGWIRDLRTSGGEIDLPPNNPFIVLGDLNVYDTDPAHHLTTLLTGDILDEITYGPDIRPDWDGTALADALPSHNAEGKDFYTWRNDTAEFNPGVLDRILYTDSVLSAVHGFILNTTIMTPEELDSAGLRSGDIMLEPNEGVVDHLPLVVDFQLLSFEPQDP